MVHNRTREECGHRMTFPWNVGEEKQEVSPPVSSISALACYRALFSLHHLVIIFRTSPLSLNSLGQSPVLAPMIT